MQKQTFTIVTVMLMTGMMAGRFVNLHDLKVAELTGLSLLTLSYGSEIWELVKKLAARPTVRTYLSSRAAQGQGLVISSSLLKKLAFIAGLVFGGLMLILDAMHRHP